VMGRAGLTDTGRVVPLREPTRRKDYRWRRMREDDAQVVARDEPKVFDLRGRCRRPVAPSVSVPSITEPVARLSARA